MTRPQPDGARTADKLRARGCEVLLAPLLRIESLAPDLPGGPWSALALTSANAARALAQHPRRAELSALPVFAVGRRTAAAARAAGFADVVSADGNEQDLVGLIAAHRAGTQPLLYLAGEERACDLAGDLAARGVEVHTAVVYRTVATVVFPAAVHAAMAGSGLDGVLHYSRRSAAIYLDCAKRSGVLDGALAACQYCLSRQVAEPLVAAGARNVRIPTRPEETALLDLIVS